MNNRNIINRIIPQTIDEIRSDENNEAINKIVKWLAKYWEKNRNNQKTKKKYISIEKYSDNETEDNINEIYSIVNIKNNENNNSLLVTGNHGVGKTLLINIILNELNYKINYFDFDLLKNNRNIKNIIEKIVNNNIIDIINKRKRRTIIVIDNIETITSSLHKTALISIIKINEKYKICPIIIISNNKHKKLLYDIKKLCYEIKIECPKNTTIMNLIKKCCKEGQINIDNDIMSSIIMNSQNDYRRLNMILYDLMNINSNIDNRTVDEYFKISKTKDRDFNLFDISSDILRDYIGIKKILEEYNKEKVLLPLMMHENYINIKKNNIDYNLKIANNLSYGDIIENYIYSEQIWEMQDLHGFYSLVLTSYLLSDNIEESKNEIEFTKDLNKTSIKKINKKNIINLNKILKNMDKNDYSNMCNLLLYYFENNKLENIQTILNSYNIAKIEHLELIFKINKITKSKQNIKLKYKEQIKKILN